MPRKPNPSPPESRSSAARRRPTPDADAALATALENPADEPGRASSMSAIMRSLLYHHYGGRIFEAARDGCRPGQPDSIHSQNCGGDDEKAHAGPERAGGAVVRDRRRRG